MGLLGGQQSSLPRRTSASVRLQVANENMNRAGRLLETLEQDITLNLPEEPAEAPEDNEDEEDNAVMNAMLGRHAAAAAAVVTSIRRAPAPGQGQGQGQGSETGASNTAPANSTSTSGSADSTRPVRRPVRNLE